MSFGGGGQLGDRAYADLKALIVGFDLQPGESLSEKALSQRLGLSRTPIREACQRLAREGLVRLVPGRGAFVAEISIPDVVELFQIREALEPFAARLAAGNPDPELIDGLIAELDATELGEPSDVEAYYDLSSRIDLAILKMAANSRLSRALDEVWTQVRRARRVASTNTSRLQGSADEHRAILQAIRARDEAGAYEAMANHVQRSLSHLLLHVGRR